ncbi:MAG: toprim domain-containing protein [Candidatus Pacebacteria bacterium]|nr:toprim domain-containing protein [Candidatus Paceibacterota bacterium]
MDAIRELTERFSQFPGIGPRQAKRFVYYLLTRPNGYLKEFSALVNELKGSITVCPSCFRFFPKRHENSSLCDICLDTHRSHEELMIVCKDVDLESIEKSHSFNGKYFVLGGTVPILDKEPNRKIRASELIKTITERKPELKEIILAVNFNPEGEHTSDYVSSLLKPIIANTPIIVSTLGRGLSTGTELEYSDSETLKNALEHRQSSNS